jgi:uncharacterized protein (DUF2237 family)
MTGALFISPLNAGELILKDFSDVSKLSLNGDAKTLKTEDGVVLRLTPSARIKAGSAFSTVKVSTAKFSSYFKFKISEPGGVRSGGADGFVFVVQPISAHASSEGGGMGYEGIQKSVGVEFDTWNNENRNKNDSDENHVGINIEGAFNGKTMPVSPAFEKGQIWHAWVDYDGSQMEVRTNTTGKRPSKPLLTRELNISEIIDGTPEAFIGFTSATGGAYANHDIISWEFRDEFKPIGAESHVDAESNIDVWIADSKRDTGAEPNKVSRRFWLSPDIWPRKQQDDVEKYQDVELGQDNYVYVRVKNRGTKAASNTTVEVYRSVPSLGNSWPKGWNLVGKTNIDTLEPNASQNVAIRWDKDEIPKPGHYCFYVRLLNDDDPMTSKERGDSLVNTRKNNNIAWRNFNVVDLLKNVTDEFEVAVQNTKDEEANIDLAFEEEDNLLDNDGAGLVVDLGELFDRWHTAGAEGVNIKSVGGTKVQLVKTPAKLIGISMKPAESQNIKMKLEVLNPMPGEGTVREYQFSTQEWVDGELVGGVDYALMTRAQDTDTDGDGIKDVDDEDDDNDSMPDVWEIEFGLNPLVPNEPIPEPTPSTTHRQSINYVLDLASHVTEQFEVTVSNLEDAANVDLVFEEKNNLLEKGEVSVIVDLGSLFQRWQEAGAEGVNVKVIEESTQVQVLKMPAKFMGISMNASESQTILIKVDALKPMPTRTTETTTSTHMRSINYVLDLASHVTEQFEFVVSNSEKAANVEFVFEEKNNLLEKGEVTVIVDLGQLFQRWQEAGAKGVNVKVIEESTQVQVLKMPAKFMGISMNANESQTIMIKVDALKPQPTRTTETTIEERISESTPMPQSINYTLDFASPVTTQFEFVVSNSEKAANVDLVFEEKNNLLEKGEVTVIVELGQLFQRWQEAGAKGVNVKVIEESTQVQVLKMPAKFMGIPMNANESQTILIKVDALKPQPTRTTETTIEERISETAPSIPMLQSIVYTLDLASPVTEQFEFVVSNSEKAGNVVLVFEEKNNLLEKGEVSVIVDLGPLFQRWQEAGAKGVNVKVIEDSTQVQVLKMPANFMDLPMDANESQTILIKVDALKPQPIRTAESTIRYVEEERISESTPSTPKQPSDVEESTPSTPKQPSDVEESTPSTPKQPSDVEESTPSTPKQPSDVEESAPSTPKQPSDVEESTPSTQPSDVEESAPSTPKQPSDVEESAPSTPKQPSDVEESAPSTQPSDVEESAPSTQPSDVEESTTSTLRQHSIHYFMDFASQMTEPFEIVVSNPEEPANTDLVFEENNKHLNNGEVKVIVDLGPLFPRWQAAGAKGFNVGILDEGPQVQLLKTPAKFMGLPMNASESQTILIKVDALKPMPTRTVETTTYQVVEEEREPTPSTLRQHSIHYFLDFASQMTEPFEMVVSNSEEPANIDLVFEENNKRLNNGEVKVIVDLGPLFPRWQAAGAKGFNVGILDEGPQVQLLKTPAKFIGLPMNASESQTILIKVDALKSQPTRTAETTTYQVVEEEREFTPILPRHSIHYFLDIASQMTEPFEMVVSNSEEPANIDLVFEENNKRLNKGEVRIIVDLGPLFPRWQTAGAKGLNVGILDKGPQVQLLKTPAKIMGIKMTAAESQIIKVKTDTFNPMPGKGTDTDGDDIKDVKEEPIPDEGDDIKDEEEPESTTILPRHSIHYFLDFASQTTAPFEMTVSNSEGPANIDLVFEENNKRLDKGEVRIIVDLGPLFPRWQAAGAKGINVGILDEGPQVQLLKTPAKIMGIKMTAAESQIIKVKTDTFNPMPKEGTDTDGDDIKDEPIQEEGDDIKDVKEEPIPESTTTPSTRRHRIHYILDFAGNMTEPFEVAVSNSEKDANVDLVFEGKSNILDKGEVNVIVDLGPLFPRWQAAGAKGVNVGILDEGPQVQLLKTPAQFKGIPMSASESQTIQIRVDAIQGTSREDSFSETTRDSTPSDGIPFDGEPRECVRLCAPPGSYYSY